MAEVPAGRTYKLRAEVASAWPGAGAVPRPSRVRRVRGPVGVAAGCAALALPAPGRAPPDPRRPEPGAGVPLSAGSRPAQEFRAGAVAKAAARAGQRTAGPGPGPGPQRRRLRPEPASVGGGS